MSATRVFGCVLGVALAHAALAAEPPADHRNFVSCPIVRDTPTVPCWLAEYKGEMYYLGIQTDVSAEFHPPLQGHKVLVEGTVKDAPRICGGIVLDPIRISPMAELDGTCNTVLPVEDQYTVPFAPRPPGPSGGRLAFDAAPGTPRPAPPAPPTGVQEFTLYYDFDMPVGGRHSATLSRIYEYASSQHAKQVGIACQRGATLLSDGTVMTEREDLPQLRAKELAKLLHGAGLATDSMRLETRAELTAARGDGDWRERRCVVRVQP
jgi:hypothetical protein